MAKDTKVDLRNKTIYSVYIRNHTEEGTFKSIISDLDRIKSIGVDYIWFLPIHPIGSENRKGKLGSPYAIKNYREVNPEFGTFDDFKKLVDEIHSREMKCMIDVVYNHTSADSWLKEKNPEFFFKDIDGNFGNKTDEWCDVIDLDYENKELWAYQIETLCMWAEIVDGFRCDVAPLIPLEFWLEARKAVKQVNSDCIWLAESVEDVFIKDNRRRGLTALSDGETFEAFDITYDYDVYYFFMDYLNEKIPLQRYVDMLNYQDINFAANYVKLRFLENHDRPRAKSYIKSQNDLLNWTAFMYFQKGTALIYGGQETENCHRPDLFNYDKIDWNTGYDISSYLKTLYEIKQDRVFQTGNYLLSVADNSETIIASYEEYEGKKVIGIFPVKSETCDIRIESIPNRIYIDKLTGRNIDIQNSTIKCDGNALIFEVE